jgi:diguanylate cyclase (GGDEF)-like protein
VISLRVKLVTYFLVLSLLPLAAAYWGFASTSRTNEERLADERLHASLRASLAGLQEELDEAEQRARSVAADPSLHRALLARDGKALERFLAGRANVRIDALGLEAGRRVPGADARVEVTGPTGPLGWVIVTVPFDRALAQRLARGAGLADQDRIAVVAGGRIVNFSGDALSLRRQLGYEGFKATLGGKRYRALGADALAGGQGLALAVVTPQEGVEQAQALARTDLLLGVGLSLLLIGLVAFVEGSSIARALRRLVHGANEITAGRLDTRVPVRTKDELGDLARAFNEMADELQRERSRLRFLTRRFGEALAATHDIAQLLRVVAETAMEGSGAQSGTVVDGGEELVRVGSADGPKRLVLPLATRDERFGELVLTGEAFDQNQRDAAATLVAHAVIALENARLHRVVQHQARIDGVTGLPNRRHCETVLAGELARGRRSNETFAFVLADLDDFKAINDCHGHPAGDRVLLAFGDILRATLRETDVSARWGGEEFAIVMPATDPEGAARLVERVRAAVESHSIVLENGERVSLTASFGIAAYPDEQSIPKLVRAADAALYEAKRGGKNRVATNAASLATA